MLVSKNTTHSLMIFNAYYRTELNGNYRKADVILLNVTLTIKTHSFGSFYYNAVAN